MTFKNALRFLHLNQPTSREYIAQRALGTSIPRIIHQTYRTWDAVPQKIRDSIDALRERNPAWKYCFYDDMAMVRFIRDAYGSAVLAHFERIDPLFGAARADLFRYLLMYQMGGVYLDLKSTIRRSLDDIICPDDKLILAQWTQGGRFEGAGRHDWDLSGKVEGGEFQQWHVICAPGHPYLRAVIHAVMRNIDCYIPRMHGSGRTAVLRLTGPIAYTLAIIPLMSQNLHRLVKQHEDIGLDYSVYETNKEHERLFGVHYSDLTVPIVQANSFRRALSSAYWMFDAARKRSNA